MLCAQCGQDNPAQVRFCGHCGAAMVTAGVTPAAVPSGDTSQAVAVPETAVEYMGFWVRLLAAIIDWVILVVVLSIVNFVLEQLVAELVFWIILPLYDWLMIGLRGQTLGKMALGIRVVDPAGNIPGLGKGFKREIIGKLVSALGLGLGVLWIAWDERKQGWHDKIAQTVVVRARREGLI